LVIVRQEKYQQQDWSHIVRPQDKRHGWSEPTMTQSGVTFKIAVEILEMCLVENGGYG